MSVSLIPFPTGLSEALPEYDWKLNTKGSSAGSWKVLSTWNFRKVGQVSSDSDFVQTANTTLTKEFRRLNSYMLFPAGPMPLWACSCTNGIVSVRNSYTSKYRTDFSWWFIILGSLWGYRFYGINRSSLTGNYRGSTLSQSRDQPRGQGLYTCAWNSPPRLGFSNLCPTKGTRIPWADTCF